MKRYFYFFIAAIAMIFASCEEALNMKVAGTEKEPVIIIEHDTTQIVIPADMTVVIVPSDSDWVQQVNDTIYHYVDTTSTDVDPRESYELRSNKEDFGNAFTDLQPTSWSLDDEVILATDVNRYAEVGNDVDTVFAPKVATLQASVGRPQMKSAYDVRGEYDINTEYLDYAVNINDGSSYQVATEAESASAMYDGKKKDLLYRKVSSIKVVDINDQLTADTIIKGKKIYRKANRTMRVEVKSLNRPLMGPEVVTLDTLTISSSAAALNNNIAVVYVEDGELPGDTIPEIHPDTVPIPGHDTIPVGPDTIPTPVVPDSGYVINNETIQGIYFSYTISPAKRIEEALLIRYETFVVPVIAKSILAPVSVSNPADYNSVAYLNGWQPAYLSNGSYLTWTINGTTAASATDATIDWLCNNQHISKISRNDFLKVATFVHVGETTRVYVDGVLYMILQ